MKESDLQKVNFEMAESILIASLIQGRIPILLVGANGIGKSHLLGEYAKVGFVEGKSEPNALVDFLDLGGLSSPQFIKYISKLGVKNLLIDDLNSILERKQEVRSASLAKICQIIDGGKKSSFTFQNRNSFDAHLSRLNFIVACTPVHIFKLQRIHAHDFLSRFVAVHIEHDNSFYDPQFLEHEDHNVVYSRRLPMKIKLKEHKTTLTNPRHQLMYDKLVSALESFGMKQIPPLHFWEIDEFGAGDWSKPFHATSIIER